MSAARGHYDVDTETWWPSERACNASYQWKRAIKAGKSTFAVTLKDGTWLQVCANRIAVESGALLVYCGNDDGRGPEYVAQAFAAGEWRETSVVSSIDGTQFHVVDDDRWWKEKSDRASTQPGRKPDSRDFRNWLRKQERRDDPIGDLARDASNDARWDGTAQGLRHRVRSSSSDSAVESALVHVLVEYEQHIEEIQRRRAARGQMSPKLRHSILLRDKFTCRHCGRSRDAGAVLHVDHIVSIAKGGETVADNLQTLCDTCNLGKGAA